jgi:hypothetical protein
MVVVGEADAVKQAMLDIKLVTEMCGIEQEKETINQIFPAHDALSERVEKTLYYGRLPSTDRPSLPLTQLAVEQFASVGLEKLARLDISRASDMSRDAYAGPTSLVLALIYLDRLKKQNPQYLRTVSSADLFLVSMMVASKFLHDDGEEDEVFNDEWAKSGNIDIKEFNRMELEFLCAIDWRVNVPTDDFDSALIKIENEISSREVKSRGWATYTDLYVLSRSPGFDGMMQMLTVTSLKLTTVCMAAYAASIFTFLGTTALLNQTPLGPTAVSNSLRTLRTGKSVSDPVPEPERIVTAADLLAASLLVTSLTSGSEDPEMEFNSDSEPQKLNLSSAFNLDSSIGDYGSVIRVNGSGWGKYGLEPPDWRMENQFIHHATANMKSASESSSRFATEFGDEKNEDDGGFLSHWSYSTLQHLLSRDRGAAKPSQCPFLSWGSISLFQTQPFSIMV